MSEDAEVTQTKDLIVNLLVAETTLEVEAVEVIQTKDLIVDLLVMGTTPMGEAAEVIQTKGTEFSKYSVSNIVIPKQNLWLKIKSKFILTMKCF